MKNKKLLIVSVILLFSALFIGWGSVGHRIINYRTILTVKPSMSFWGSWSDSLAAHASDADNRRSIDPNEAPKHYINIDNFPEFLANGYISQNFDSLVLIHGYSFVIQQGILPWAILNTFDSLKIAFQNNQFHRAMLLASDLGHYLGDLCMPLHLTRNYNGQYTGQTGVHSRYESNMINTYQSQILYTGDTLYYIDNISNFIFNMLYTNYAYVDSVLRCDSIAKAFAGNTSSSTYYSKLWELSKGFTIKLFKEASHKLTCLIYTAWINAGSPTYSEEYFTTKNDLDFQLTQNYPNPFSVGGSSALSGNATTRISWKSPVSGHQSLKIYDLLGNEIATLFNGFNDAGSHTVEFNANKFYLNSGVYFYRLQIGQYSETKKMLILK